MTKWLKLFLAALITVGCVQEIPVEELETESFTEGDANSVSTPAPPIETDSQPPYFISLSPSGIQPATTEFVSLQVQVNEFSECRYDLSPKSFVEMLYDLTSNNNLLHFTQMNVSNDQSYRFYFRCRDLSKNKNESNIAEVNFYVDKKGVVDVVKPVIGNIAPSGLIKELRPIELTLNEQGLCKISNSSSDTYESMVTMITTDGLNHVHELNSSNFNIDTDYSFFILCRDLAGNESDKKTTTFKIEKPEPVIVDFDKSAREILQKNCFTCHGGSATYKNLNVADDNSLFNPVSKFIVKGSPGESKIYLSLTGSMNIDPMPPSGQLSESDREVIRKWISEMEKDSDNSGSSGGDNIACLPEEDLNSALTRMLLNEEIGRSFDVLLGGSKYQPDLSDLPGKIGNKFGIIKDGSLQSLSTKDVNTIFDSFEKSIDLFISDKTHRIFTCSSLTGPSLNSCLDSNLMPLVYRAWRRPISSAVKQELYSAFTNGTFDEVLKTQLLAILLDPQFLFISFDDDQIPRKLNSFEIAERLAFLIWGRVPPVNLLDYASSNDLTQKDKLLYAINLLFDFDGGLDPNDFRRQYAWSFYHDLQNQWLEIDHIDRRNVASGVNFNKGELKWATMFYIEENFRKNKSIKDLYSSNFVVVTQNTDHLYDVDFNQAIEAEYDIYHTNGHSFRKMIMPETSRKGLLTQAGVLAANAGRKTDVNPTERGLWHTSNIMCESPDGVPANIPLDDAIVGNPNLSLKEKFAEHAKSPNCASCHKIMDPIGFGLFGYDVIGQERSKDHSGFDIDPSGELEGQFFNTVDKLVDIVASSDKTESCTMSHVTTFAVGRAVDAKSSCTTQKILKEVKAKNGGLRDILQEVLLSDLFLMRRK